MSIEKAFEVDVFEHPRFCDEFSHLCKQWFFGFCKSLLDRHCNHLYILVSFNFVLDGHTSLIDCLALFLSIDQAFEVDVFEHPRFCDEFSHLRKRRFLGFCKSLVDLHRTQMDILVFVKVVLDGHSSLIDHLCELIKRLK